MKFEHLNLHEDLKTALIKNNFFELTPIQEKSIPYSMEGRDIIGLAQTGTGKTIAYLVPIIHQFLTNSISGISTLILAPTRELAIQISDQATLLLANTKYKSFSIIGGEGYEAQKNKINHFEGILVGTPGRLIDLIQKGDLNLNLIQFLVVDESDKMFDMGFVKDVRFLLRKTENRKQTFLLSATLSMDVIHLADKFLKDPVEVQIESVNKVAENIDQKLIHLGEDEKVAYLVNLILNNSIEDHGIIFTNYKNHIFHLVNVLRNYSIPAAGISSDFDQKKRMRLFKEFKTGKYRYMIATDVASRGIDINSITIVYNYDLPMDTENYVHRIGRTARAGKSGLAISFCSERDYSQLEKIENYLKQKIDVLKVEENFLQFPQGDFQRFVTQDIFEIRKNQSNERQSKKGFQNQKIRNNRRNNPRKDRNEFGNRKVEKRGEKLEKSTKSFQDEKSIHKPQKSRHYDKGFHPNVKKQRSEYVDNKTRSTDSINSSSSNNRRNLFDINDYNADKRIESKKSLWKKIKSIFGS